MRSVVSMTTSSDRIIRRISDAQKRDQGSQRAFFGVFTLLFVASAVLTIVWCRSMSAMGEMRMPGGWTMSMAWMRMPGQTWLGAAASFVGMWTVMMLAMMLPCLVPMLGHYGQAVDETGKMRLGWLTALAGAGYFFVWTAFGMAAYALGVALSTVATAAPCAGARSPNRSRCGHPDRRLFPVHGVQGAAPGLLPGRTRVWPNNAGRHRDGLAARPATRTRLQLLLCRSDGDSVGDGSHEPWRDGSRGGSDQRRTSRAGH